MTGRSPHLAIAVTILAALMPAASTSAQDLPATQLQDHAQVVRQSMLTRSLLRRRANPSTALRPEGKGAALVLPRCNTEGLTLHLAGISTAVASGAHAVLLLDQTGWHGARNLVVPDNITLLPLPPRSPELNSSRTSGSSCATTGSQTACSLPTPTSSTIAAAPERPRRPALAHHALDLRRWAHRS